VPEYVFAVRKRVGQFEKDRSASSAHQVGQEESKGVSRALDGVTMSLKIHRFYDPFLKSNLLLKTAFAKLAAKASSSQCVCHNPYNKKSSSVICRCRFQNLSVLETRRRTCTTYMSFKEAQALPFTSEHQPSLKESLLRIATATKRRKAVAKSKLGAAWVATTLAYNITNLKNKSAFKIASAIRVRAVEDYNTYSKPRCIYSQFAVSQMKPPSPLVLPDCLDSTVPTTTKEEVQKHRALAKDRLRDAAESTIFICGMAPLDYDDP